MSLILIFSMTASIMLIPNVSAHTPAWKIPTYAFITVSPNPIGVGQSAYVIMWLNWVFDGASPTPPATINRFQNYKITITGPNGTISKTFPVTTDPTSAQDYPFTPTVAGTYNLTFSFPGQAINITDDQKTSLFINDTYLPSSATTTLTVQQTAVPGAITGEPLPTQYWTRPIYGENSNWYNLASNWLGTGDPGYSGFGFSANQQSYPGDAVGSQTSHIMWTKPIQAGGVVGGTTSTSIIGNTFFEGSAYSQRYTDPIILDGILYYCPPIAWSGSNSGPETAVNLQTGQILWSKSTIPQISFGYIYDAEDPNQHGTWPPILIASVSGGWHAFDGLTGTSIFNVTNIPSGTTMLGPSGEHLILAFTNKGTARAPHYYFTEWNSSKLWDNTYSGPSTVPGLIPTYTAGNNPALYDWNVSMPYVTTAPTIENAFYNNMAICENGTLPGPGAFYAATTPTGFPDSPYNYFGVNLQTSGTIGTVLWTTTVQPPSGNLTVSPGSADPTADSGHGVFVEAYKETMQWVGYSMATGKHLWGPTPMQSALDYYGNPAIPIVGGVCAMGNLYSTGYAGILYCYDLTTGNIKWEYGNGGSGNSTYAGFNTPFGVYPNQINAIGNGVVYMVTTEHTIETPLFKGSVATAVNATTGKQIWTLSGYTGEFFTISYAMADGYNTWFNGYDNSIYVVGRGPSATTTEAAPAVSTIGSNVVIRGTVMDVSAGTTQTQQAADFANGVPCASDASMTQWMGYVYQQQAPPTNFTGVPVTISVTDSNNNCYNIGQAKTDSTGMYSLTWKPTVAGNYTVTATFGGTNGYWPSTSETTFNIMNAPVATAAPTPTPASNTNTYVLGLGIAIIVVIIIVGAVLALLMLRKRQ